MKKLADDASPQPGSIIEPPAESDNSATQDVKPAEAPSPSESQGDKPLGTMEDFIAEGLANQGAEIDQPAEGTEEPPASEPEPDQETAKEDAEAKPADDSEATEPDETEAKSDEDKRFDKHPRFQKLIKDRREFKEQAEKLEAEIEDYRADREAMEQFRGFMQQNNLNTDMVNEAINLRILAETDPNAFLDQIIPVVQQVAQMTGRIPAPQYQQQVEAGTLDRETALQLSREQGQAQMQQRTAQQQQQSSQQERYNLATAAIDMVTNVKKGSDPDFDKKQEPFADKLELLMRQSIQQGVIPTVEQATKMAEDAYEAVSKQALAYAPKAQQKEMAPVTNGAAAPVQRQPTSMEEAIVQGIEQAGGRVL